MHFGKFNLTAAMILSFSLSVFAQGYFPGSGEEEDPNASSCVGDGCGLEFPNQNEDSNQASSEAPEQNSSENHSENNPENASDNVQTASDSSATDSITAKNGTKSTGIEYEDEDDEDDARPYYINESASDYAARKEGFTKQLTFGVRAEGGLNFTFGKKADGWGLGYEGGAGLVGRLPIYRRTLGLQMELSYVLRRYNFEKDVSYSHDEAEITQTLFKIPVMLQYFFDEDGFYINFGLNLGLKMSAETTYRQTITNNEGKIDKRKSSNTLPTVGVEFGAVVDLGYSITQWMAVDLRVIQNFNNLLDVNRAAETTAMNAQLYTLHTTLGLSFFI